jgi:dCTP diphosphatase
VVELAREETLHRRLGEEISDVLLYLVLLADVLDIDLPVAARAKLAEAHVRYPPGRNPHREK